MDFESKKRLRRERARFKHMKKEGLAKALQPEMSSEGAKEAAREKAKRPSKEKGIIGTIRYFYENEYKKLLWITITMLILAIAQISYQVATTGDFINKGVALKGGITVTVPGATYDAAMLEQQLNERFNGYDVGVRKLTSAGKQTGIVIDADITKKEDTENFISFISEKIGLSKENFSLEVTGASLGASFFREAIIALIVAFIFMGITVFLYFRVPIPSLLVILAAFSDIISTIAVVNLLGIKISTAGIAAYLMLIGYSVDTDILLTTRVLRRREGTIMDGVYSALKTGLTMTFTTLAAVLIGLIFSKSDVLKQIMMILLIGLIFDMFYTWIQNTAALRLYLEKRPDKGEIKAENM